MGSREYLKLLGVLIIVVGFVLKWDTTAVVVIAAIGMTSGYCGTLVTPMAANFNTLPVALLEMKDQMGVIKQQAPIAVILLIVQIGLMYFFAF
ncbi:DUF979 family protein [Lactobacillus johnsonii]|uniref:5-oxoproline transporter, DUF979 family subunit n=1 Tax=Lactobacillus johnsonii TaxID=33959 RepID=UPI0026066C96